MGLINSHVDDLYRLCYALDYPGKFDFFMMEVGSNKVQKLGRFTSVPSWSPRGRFFATGTIESSKLLIWDANTLTDIWSYPPSGRSAPDVRKIDLPDACLSRVQHNPKSKITSISWSSDGASLAIVCSAPEDKTSDVCIVPLDKWY
ncbi:MAG: hypothetical protein ACOYYS_17850 [Chloroflexota bacterium]